VLESLNHSIKALYIELERLSEIYEELTDTDVRESLHMTLNYFFVWGKELDTLPISYGMFSLEGDKAVAQAVNAFLSSVSSIPEVNNIPLGGERLGFLQNSNITTPGGCQYDEFIGHADEPLSPNALPEDLFDEGDYD